LAATPPPKRPSVRTGTRTVFGVRPSVAEHASSSSKVRGVIGVIRDNADQARWPGLSKRNPVTTYLMCGKAYTWDELYEVSKAEAADLPPATWRDGTFDFNGYLVESMQVGTIKEVDDEDD
jgi:hypothetical protein